MDGFLVVRREGGRDGGIEGKVIDAQTQWDMETRTNIPSFPPSLPPSAHTQLDMVGLMRHRRRRGEEGGEEEGRERVKTHFLKKKGIYHYK